MRAPSARTVTIASLAVLAANLVVSAVLAQTPEAAGPQCHKDSAPSDLMLSVSRTIQPVEGEQGPSESREALRRYLEQVPFKVSADDFQAETLADGSQRFNYVQDGVILAYADVSYVEDGWVLHDIVICDSLTK